MFALKRHRYRIFSFQFLRTFILFKPHQTATITVKVNRRFGMVNNVVEEFKRTSGCKNKFSFNHRNLHIRADACAGPAQRGQYQFIFHDDESNILTMGPASKSRHWILPSYVIAYGSAACERYRTGHCYADIA